jgi:hypothetical protein
MNRRIAARNANGPKSSSTIRQTTAASRPRFWVPSPEEIDQRAAEVRETWSEQRLRKRAGMVPAELVLLPVPIQQQSRAMTD